MDCCVRCWRYLWPSAEHRDIGLGLLEGGPGPGLGPRRGEDA